ncbi:uncharacterized protein Triagg1_7909 [Trichoderma aggressivum f. europaeum]|uniref:Uncharacterized protein n=1 Tax=Trichoderma aggressivum f. europaeum TaxID=173218 RepID=A0AAE1I8T8_9HYPO|nr:hypothetical protein Triagg1_7909 [Trichoderma aggressivum f. europaeum]
MASFRGHDSFDHDETFLPSANACATAAGTVDQTMDTELELTEPKLSYSWTYWYAKFTELNEYEYLPDPVETQGAHLISAPSSPNVVESRHDPSSFYDHLLERLRGLALRQSIRENIYGEEFANEWPISRTPRALAKEIRIARRKARDALLHLDSPSTSSDSEYEPAWRRRIREAREKKRRAKKQAKLLAQAQAQTEDPARIQLQPRVRSRSMQVEPQPQSRFLLEPIVEDEAEQSPIPATMALTDAVRQMTMPLSRELGDDVRNSN